jgi:trigger factor
LETVVTDGALGKKLVEITVPVEELAKERVKVLQGLRKGVKIPGFRPGKVPLSLIESRYTEEIKAELIQRVIPEFYGRALSETDLEPVGQPEFDFGDMVEGEPFIFKATIEVLPEVVVDNYGGMELTKTVRPVSEEDVATALEQLRQENATMVPVERVAAEGDLINLELTVLDRTGVQLIGEKSQEVTYALGSNVLGEKFDEALTGSTVGQNLDVVSTTSPDFERRALAGKETRFKALVQEVVERKLPELDDEFAKDVNDRFENLETLTDYIRQSLEEREEERVQGELRHQLLNGLVDQNPFDPPETMVRRFLDDLLANYKKGHENPEIVDEELFANEHRPTAIREIKSYLLLEALAKKENIDVSDEEVTQRIEELAERTGMPPAKYRAGLIRAKQFDSFRERLKEKKIFDFLLEQSKIKVKNL